MDFNGMTQVAVCRLKSRQQQQQQPMQQTAVKPKSLSLSCRATLDVGVWYILCRTLKYLLPTAQGVWQKCTSPRLKINHTSPIHGVKFLYVPILL